MTSTHSRLFLLLAVAGAFACGSDDGDASAAATTSELSDAATMEAVIVASVTPSDLTDGESASASADATVEALLGDCVTSVTTATTTTWTLSACTGPWGLVTVDGTIVGSYRIGRTGIVGTLTVDLVTSEGGTLDFDADITYGTDGSIAVESTASGLGRRGNVTSRTGSYTLNLDGDCVAVDGEWSGTRSDAWTLVVVGYSACSGACPSGTLTRTGVVGGTLAFDGTDTAVFTSTGGESREVSLVCGE